MKTITLSMIFFVGFFAITHAFAAVNVAEHPNIILILMDDMGWRDIGFMGNKFVETPNIDHLAKAGVIFSQAYASAPNCAPTRACLMSGQYTSRHGVYTVVDPNEPADSPRHKILPAESNAELATSYVTIAEALKNSGYATGFFGMWNLGRGRTTPVSPSGQGFQTVIFPESIGFAKDAYFDKSGNYLSDRLTDEVIRFIEQNTKQPFFVYLPDHAVHAPFEPKAELLKKYEEKASRTSASDNAAYAATIEAVDQNVARIMETLNKLKIADNTYVIFTSDNGGSERDTSPLRGGKGQLYEGGIRVPLAIWGPRLKHAGTLSDKPVASIDIYPTILELANIEKPSGTNLDGLSLVSILQGKAILNRKSLFWHFPCYIGKGVPSSAVREGDFKLIEFFEDGGKLELFNLRDDPGEQNNLFNSHPEKVAALHKTLQSWQQESRASIPIQANPKYDPQARGKKGPKQKNK